MGREVDAAHRRPGDGPGPRAGMGSPARDLHPQQHRVPPPRAGPAAPRARPAEPATRIAGRPVVVVVPRPASSRAELASIEAFIREQNPVLVGVDRGADAAPGRRSPPRHRGPVRRAGRRRAALGQGAAGRPRRRRPGRQRRAPPRRAARAARRPPAAPRVLRHHRGRRAAARRRRARPADRRGRACTPASTSSWTGSAPVSPAPTSPG